MAGVKVLSEERIGELVRPYLLGSQVAVNEEVTAKLRVYLEMLLRWNERTNLTAIREPEAIVTRHFGEGLYASLCILGGVQAVLDLGSGAGFPGIPMKLLRPELAMTLAESQGKKASFLRDVVRALGLEVEIHGGRAEEMVGSRRFELVAMRAVDKPVAAFRTACALSRGEVMVLTTEGEFEKLGVAAGRAFAIPESAAGKVFLVDVAVADVPRGTSQ